MSDNAKLKRKVQVAVESETTKGTAESVTAADAKILVYDPVFNFNPAQFKRNVTRKSLSKIPSLPGQRPCEVTFQVELMGPPLANIGDAPSQSDLWTACAVGETLTGGTSVDYAPISDQDDMKTVTIAFFEDGLKKVLAGAMGNARIIFKVGEPVMVEFTFQGKYSSYSDVSMLSPSYPAEKPFIFMGASVNVGGDELIFDNMEFNLQNSITLRPDPSDAGGIIAAQIVDREPVITFDPELVSQSTHDFWGKLISENTMTFNLVMNSSDNVQCTLNFPAVRYTASNPGDRDGISTMESTLEVCASTTSANDDEFSLRFAVSTTTSTTTTSTSTTTTSTTTTTT